MERGQLELFNTYKHAMHNLGGKMVNMNEALSVDDNKPY